MKKLLLGLISLFSLYPCLGYFYQAEELFDGNQNIVLLSDIHGFKMGVTGIAKNREKRRIQEACNAQRRQLIAQAKKVQGLVIVEDALFGSAEITDDCILSNIKNAMLADFESNPRKFDQNKNYSQLLPDLSILENDSKYSYLSPLLFLTQYCHQQQINSVNIECRFSLKTDLLIDLLDCYKRNIKTVKSFNDVEKFTQIYKEKLETFKKEHTRWKKVLRDAIAKHGDQVTTGQLVTDNSIALHNYDIGMKVTIEDPTSEMDIFWYNELIQKNKRNKINLHDVIFPDLQILHAIAQSKDKKNIYICAGGSHIKAIREILISKLGFESKRQTESTLSQEIPAAVDLQDFFSKPDKS